MIDSRLSAEEKVSLYARRAGIGSDILEQQRLVKMLDEMEAAGQQVRKGLLRKDEPAVAFQLPAGNLK